MNLHAALPLVLVLLLTLTQENKIICCLHCTSWGKQCSCYEHTSRRAAAAMDQGFFMAQCCMSAASLMLFGHCELR